MAKMKMKIRTQQLFPERERCVIKSCGVTLESRLFLFLLFAVPAFGQCQDSPITGHIPSAVPGYGETNAQKEELERDIAAARARFWATYPNKPGNAEARKRFADLLDAKDVYYLIANSGLAEMTSNVGHPEMQSTLADTIARSSDLRELDGGIRGSASQEFDAWQHVFYERLKANGGVLTLRAYDNYWNKAMPESEKQRRAYVRQRDFAEFDPRGVVPSEYDDPKDPAKYANMLYLRYGGIDCPAPDERVRKMKEVLGAEIVENAARQIRRAAKTKDGLLVVTVAFTPSTGINGSQQLNYSIPESGVIGSYRNPRGASNSDLV